jgi:hypothetical protein
MMSNPAPSRSLAAATGAAAILLALGSPAVADPNVYEVGRDPAVGFNLISWGTGALAQHWTIAINQLNAAGFREVSISPVRIVNPSTGQISLGGLPLSQQQQPMANIAAGVARAKELGFRVTLDPFTEYPDVGGTWRANYSPDSPEEEATFWADYQAYMVEVAELAQQYGVDAMTVGTEMKGLDDNPGNADHWNDVLTAVDAVYDGQIGYAANWDNYASSNVVNNLWSHPVVDFIGIDSYFRFFGEIPSGTANAIQSFPDADFAELVASAWTNKLENELLPFAESMGKPLVFTEVGYQHHNGTSRNPQTESGSVDTAEQRLAFQGLLKALDGRADWFHAMHIWHWSMNGNTGSTWDIGADVDNEDLETYLRSFVATAVQPLAGDYNGNGVVDAADYTVWRDALGQHVLNFSGADGDGDGVIDEGDYAVWKENFGATGGSGAVAASVPEPSSLLLAVLTFLVAVVGARHARSH